MMRSAATAVFLLVAIGLGGCATLEHGTLDDVSVVTDPPGAEVVSSSGTTCLSPCQVSGPRQDSFAITVSKPGFVTQSLSSEAKPDTAAIAEASDLKASADALGRVIDVQDGSHYTHEPKAFVVKLEPQS